MLLQDPPCLLNTTIEGQQIPFVSKFKRKLMFLIIIASWCRVTIIIQLSALQQCTSKVHCYSAVVEFPGKVQSYIGHKDLSCPSPASGSGDPPWILKLGGLEGSGQRLISIIGKTKRMAFIVEQNKKIFSKFSDFLKINDF